MRDVLDGTERIVADAVLATGVFASAKCRLGIDPRVVQALRSDLLSRRRKALLGSWQRLHEAHGVDPGDTPSDRALRGSLENHVLAELARQLARREGCSLGAHNPAPQ